MTPETRARVWHVVSDFAIALGFGMGVWGVILFIDYVLR